MQTTPYFSIVIPTLNRRQELCRAVRSCLAQSFEDFEVIVVDDGSAEPLVEAIAAFDDPRVRCIRHERNRGVCPARNTGIRASSGQWVVFLDSDHEMLPNCLSRALQVVNTCSDVVDRFGFQHRFDDGHLSPFPLPHQKTLGYLEWLKWIEVVEWSDALWVTGRHCFDQCMLPESSVFEFSYALNFARHFSTRLIPEVLAMQHTDSPDRLSYAAPPKSPEAVRSGALDQIEDWVQVLAEHGTALKTHCPKQYGCVLRALSRAYSLAGRRWDATSTAVAGIMINPAGKANWVNLLLTLSGRRCLTAVSRMRAGRRLRAASRSCIHTVRPSPGAQGA